MYQFGSISLVLESIIKEGIAHSNHSRIVFHFVLELLLPHPVTWLPTIHDVLVSHQMVNYFDVVDDVQNQSFDFREHQIVTFIVKLTVSLKLFLEILFVVRQFTLPNSILTAT